MIRRTRLEVYADAAGDWRWRLIARTGRIVAAAGEGHTSKRKAINAARAVAGLMAQAWLEVAA